MPKRIKLHARMSMNIHERYGFDTTSHAMLSLSLCCVTDSILTVTYTRIHFFKIHEVSLALLYPDVVDVVLSLKRYNCYTCSVHGKRFLVYIPTHCEIVSFYVFSHTFQFLKIHGNRERTIIPSTK